MLRRGAATVRRCYGDRKKHLFPVFSLRMLESGFLAVAGLSATAKPPSWRTGVLRECLLPLFPCFIGSFIAYRMDQLIE